MCTDEFTGVFCEQKEKTDEFIYLHQRQAFRFNNDGLFIGKTDSMIDVDVFVYNSCSTIIHGETVIFGGQDSRQVTIDN